MSRSRILARAVINQARNGLKILSRKPLTKPSFEGLTLEPDDLALARDWLSKPEAWVDVEPVRTFESAFAKWVGCDHAVSFLGARVALSAVVYALDLKPGDEVVLPGYTCVVVPNAFTFEGVVPVYCDIELETFGPDVESLKSCITSKTRAVLLHHMYGLVCRDYEAILDLAKERDLAVIEDCAQATGATFQGKPVGTRGDVGIYSMEKSKLFTTVQGGVAATHDPALAERLRMFQKQAGLPDRSRTHDLLKNVFLIYYQNKDRQRWWRSDWARWQYESFHVLSTTQEEVDRKRPDHYGKSLPAPLAALGVNQLEKIDRFNEKRRAHAKRWDTWCGEQGFQSPLVVADSTPVFLRYPVMVDAVMKSDLSRLRDLLGFFPGVWFVSHLHPAPSTLETCPNAARAVRECINLPCLYDDD